MGTRSDRKNSGNRKPPVAIPLTFERAVEGLLAVDPKGPIKKPAKKKPGRKKKG